MQCICRDEARGVRRVSMYPRDSAGSPRTSYSPMWSHHSEFSWDTYGASCSQMRSFEVLGAPTSTNHPNQGPLEQAGDQRNSKGGPFAGYGTPWSLCTAGPLGQMHPSRKILATSMSTFNPRPAGGGGANIAAPVGFSR